LGYGPNAGQSNPSRFSLPAFDALFERQRDLPDGPERLQAMHEAQRLLVAYMPMKAHIHHVSTDLAGPQVRGYHRHLFVPNFWLYVDVGGAPSP
jgi:ABC-type transport system substrate-binding protein